MRTFILFAALLLLALQIQAKAPQGRTEKALNQELGEDDQDMAVSFGGDEASALQDADVRSGLVCYCRRTSCGFLERIYGACRYRGVIYRLCCR
ncbi:neutrophil antibiotic peptide NP-1-like [Nannospalax galili]|uniref:neutrophil antibiotic peptide NP-1-like n=1 Tax=Nannospalax galili TaxID=1026970 RepID=UPI0004ED5478|nr:neutrophil antibiotic peptide NP-1-like [Nannospalax galili]